MVKFESLGDRGILILSPDGPLEKADFERLSQEIDPFIATHGGLTGLMIYAKPFPAGTALRRSCRISMGGAG
jgi:hypothetical protein